MEATLKTSNIKSKTYPLYLAFVIDTCTDFAKSLTCLSKFGDVLAFQATRDGLALSSTNSSKTAFARFKFSAAYWSKYSLTRDMPSTCTTQPLSEEVKAEVGLKVRLKSN